MNDTHNFSLDIIDINTKISDLKIELKNCKCHHVLRKIYLKNHINYLNKLKRSIKKFWNYGIPEKLANIQDEFFEGGLEEKISSEITNEVKKSKNRAKKHIDMCIWMLEEAIENEMTLHELLENNNKLLELIKRKDENTL